MHCNYSHGIRKLPSSCRPETVHALFMLFATGYALLCNKTLQVCLKVTACTMPRVSHHVFHAVLCRQSVNLASNQLTATAAFVIAVAIKKNQYLRYASPYQNDEAYLTREE